MTRICMMPYRACADSSLMLAQRGWTPRLSRPRRHLPRRPACRSTQQPQCPRRRDERVRGGQVPGHPLGGAEGGQRVGVLAAHRLEHPARGVKHRRRPGFSFR